ncbi:MAG: ABC transporter [Candidatus Lloydbacteria bacterium RIFCSPHIGHO2_01_FULL_49_22]|uniref:ABC transporter n=1 Tax=Candidatus Lloydbacteria bacterium RIFCSPHIGHO2_01_FULL_49_22 TaxID=1798658 RepID=A0A1G2CXF8_9BACT|nr:MAG: ABC transporter [Candidatus Lloydbacteria bacterium RIFCSPHIGHO2_01_FULL_49_22]OGZ10350.1 MAG: ABC transporter [Candidatus Lloydbacteria bacterium RIFCSPHIGHO2_02_FULL_50_18]
MIKVNNLTKTYPGEVPTRALRGVSFEIKKGEFVALMGRSGSGKSTLLHQLGLLDIPTSGTVLIDNVDILALSDAERTSFRLNHLGYVFQEYALIAEFTALENVYFPGMALGGTHNEERASELLKLVGLEERLHHYPGEMSGGEQQRVAIARALINSPKILFADEATANLDTVSSEVVYRLFQKLNKELNQTIIMITHEPEDRKYMDRVIWLKDGLIEKED